MPVAAPTSPRLRVVLADAAFDTGQPLLAGVAEERLFGAAEAAGHHGPYALFGAGDWLLGAATRRIDGSVERATEELYAALLAAAGGRPLARIWNYVPGINDPDATGLENYRGFCRARARAFDAVFGRDAQRQMSAASAVGCDAPALTVVFAATTRPVHHFENPNQVPAYDYPADYGPRSPSFARATAVETATGPVWFISGTAAIRGHATVAPHDVVAQVDCTLENLAALARACGLPADLRLQPRGPRAFKVYLRHAADRPAVAALLDERLFRPDDVVSWVRADICRRDLAFEIEASLGLPAAPAGART